MVNLVKHDLEFILKQIKIAEAHAAGGDLAALVAGYNGNDGYAPRPTCFPTACARSTAATTTCSRAARTGARRISPSRASSRRPT